MKHKDTCRHYVEIFDIRGGNLFKTGQGAAGATFAETLHLFEQARRQAVPDDKATFLVDLHDEKGDLLDTVMINGRGFKTLTGERIPTRSETRRYDREFWQSARSVGEGVRDGR